ncbi:MAG: hypothetical protein K9M57_01835 [Phycisphaerae bacterium]|nr:hypothetical protein [Phycisphaerae bacterium]
MNAKNASVIGLIFLSLLVIPAWGEISAPKVTVSALEKEYLFQANGVPTAGLIQDHIGWARQMVERLNKIKAPASVSFKKELKALKTIESQLTKADLTEEALLKLYLDTREVKRSIAFKNPFIDFNKILVIDNPYPGRSQEPAHEARHRNGHLAQNGGRLVVLGGLDPDSPVKQLAPEAGQLGSFWRPDLSFDGTKVLFCMKPQDEQVFHIFEMNADGTDLKQLTFGDYDDLDPIYLPDGKIMFSTSRANTYIRCMPYTYSFVLARCDADGKNIYIISRNSECDYLPSLMNDGRVIYSRWEYTDKALWRVQSLWTVNPDGTNVRAFWGNQSVWPDHTTEPRAIPGSQNIFFTGLGHHAWFDGCVGQINPAEGLNFPKGLYKVTQDVEWPESGDGPIDPKLNDQYHREGAYAEYKTPYPLSEEYYLVSARSGGGRAKFKLFLMDVYGNRELLWEGKYNAIHAMPFKARVVPPMQPDSVKWPKIDPAKPQAVAPGILYTNNVFDGAPEIPRDKVKYLRIIQMDPKTYSTWAKTYQHDGPAVGASQAESVKFVHGTVPVEKDGSVCFELPPGKAFYFQLIDENYMCIQNMRSFTGVMPGETRGCNGCHELQQNTGNTSSSIPNRSIAMTNGPVKPTPPPWAGQSVSYQRFVQPVLDQYCVECHNEKHKNPALNFKFRDSKIGWQIRVQTRPDEKSPFTEPYLTLAARGDYVRWGQSMEKDDVGVPVSLAGTFIVEGYGTHDPESLKTLPPMSILSHKSKVIRNAMSGKHHKVKVDQASLRRLIAWTDCNGPYLGKEEIRQMYDPKIENIASLPVRPRVGTAPEIQRFNLYQNGNSVAAATGPLKLAPDNYQSARHGSSLPRPESLLAVPAAYRSLETPKSQGLPQKAKIISAAYGQGKTYKDVTETVKGLWTAGQSTKLTQYNTFFGDPVFGVAKDLKITYTLAGKTKEAIFSENTPIQIMR